MKGALDDPDSLSRVVKDVESVFLMGTPFEDGTEGEIRRGKLMADIAKENNIEHILYSSVANADKNTGIPHFESKYKIELLEFLILLLVLLFLWKTCLVQD